MITYNDLYEAFRKEKYSEQLQPMRKKFVQEAFEYFEDKKNFLKKGDDMFSEMAIKNKKKLENALSSFRGLFRLRKKKILNLAFVASEVGISKKDFENLLGFEKDLFEEIVRSLEKEEKAISDEMSGREVVERKHILVRFLDNVSEFLNFDGEEVGPFEKGEIANLEKEIVDILSQDNKLEILDDE